MRSRASTGGAATRRSAGVWTAAARRFRSDRVGMVSLVVVALFILLVVLGRASAWSPATGSSSAACRTRRRPSSARQRRPRAIAVAGAERAERRHLGDRPARASLQGMGRGGEEVQDHRARQGRRRCRSAPTGSAATSSPRRSRARRSRSSSASPRRCWRPRSARCSARSPASSAARSATCSSGSTTSSPRSRASC